MKCGRIGWWSKAPEALLRQVNDRIDARASSAAEIYREFNLCRFTSAGGFRVYVAQRRKERAARENGGQLSAISSQPAITAEHAEDAEQKLEIENPKSKTDGDGDLLSQCLKAIQSEVLAGRTKVYELTGAVKALMDLERVRLLAASDKRAEELHAIKLAELKAKQEQALEEVSTASQLTAEQVAAIRRQVLGL